jgi:hypothetical protein
MCRYKQIRCSVFGITGLAIFVLLHHWPEH